MRRYRVIVGKTEKPSPTLTAQITQDEQLLEATAEQAAFFNQADSHPLTHISHSV